MKFKETAQFVFVLFLFLFVMSVIIGAVKGVGPVPDNVQSIINLSCLVVAVIAGYIQYRRHKAQSRL